MENKEIVESKLAEALETAIKGMQKEGLLENVEAFDLDFTGKEISVKFNESVEKVEESEKIKELALKTKGEDKDVNPYASIRDVQYIHPENRWCEFLAAAYYWPKRNGGALLKMGDYQRYVGWDNPRQDARYFEWLEKAGYVIRIKEPGARAYSYEVTPLGEKVVRYMIRSFGERAVNPFEVVKGDRMERHNLDPSLTSKTDQMYKGEVAFAYQGKNDAAPRERIVVPEAVYDRDIDTGTQRRIFGYDTGSMDEKMVRQLKRIFSAVNHELRAELGIQSDLKGIRCSQLILDNLDEEQLEIYKKILNKAKGKIAAIGADKYYRNFMLERGGKVEPVNRGLLKSGNLNKDDATFHDINRRSNYIEED